MFPGPGNNPHLSPLRTSSVAIGFGSRKEWPWALVHSCSACLVCGQHCIGHFANIDLFIPHNNLVGKNYDTARKHVQVPQDGEWQSWGTSPPCPVPEVPLTSARGLKKKPSEILREALNQESEKSENRKIRNQKNLKSEKSKNLCSLFLNLERWSVRTREGEWLFGSHGRQVPGVGSARPPPVRCPVPPYHSPMGPPVRGACFSDSCDMSHIFLPRAVLPASPQPLPRSATPSAVPPVLLQS